MLGCSTSARRWGEQSDRQRTWAEIFLRKQHLRRRISRSPAERLEQRPLLELPREPEVAQLHPTPFIQQHVLQLQVPMHDALPMHIRDSQTQLPEQYARLVLAEAALLGEVVEELAPAAELGDEPDAGLGRDDLVQLRDVRVVQLAVVVDLAGERGGHGLGDLLYGDAGARQTVRAQPHLPVRPCADARS